MKRKVTLGLLFALTIVFAVVAQEDPWYRPLSPQGQSLGVGYGTQLPSVATVGTDPGNGELFVDMDAAPSGGPLLRIYDGIAVAWADMGSVLGAGSTLVFEGATADAFEITITPTDTTGDVTLTLPGDNGDWAGTGAFMLSTLTTNAPEAANSVWGGTSLLIAEGATPNAFETRMAFPDQPADVTITWPTDNLEWAGTGTPILDVNTNAPGDALSVWVLTGNIFFEGGTADGVHTTIVATDPTVGTATFFLPDQAAAANNYALAFSTLATNALDVTNSVWGGSNEIVFEGVTADGFETHLMSIDPTADRALYLDDNGGALDTWQVHREDFNNCLASSFAEDYTPAVVTDTSENLLVLNGSDIGMIHYRFEAPNGPGYAGALEPCNNGALDIDNFSDDVDNEGADFTIGGATGRDGIGYMFDEDSTGESYCEISVTMTDVSEIDSFYFGFVLAEAYQDAGAVEGHNTWALFRIIDAAGNVVVRTELNGGGTLTDDVGTNFVDNATHVYQVRIDADDVDFYEDGVQLVQANAVLDADNGDQFHCGFGYVNAAGDGTPAPGLVVNYIEYGTIQ